MNNSAQSVTTDNATNMNNDKKITTKMSHYITINNNDETGFE